MKIKLNGRTVDIEPATTPDIDAIVSKHTAFGSLEELVTTPAYWPSLYLAGKSTTDKAELVRLALAYNHSQAMRMDKRRAACQDFQILTETWDQCAELAFQEVVS